jgi:hypothetical protein
MTHREVITFV